VTTRLEFGSKAEADDVRAEHADHLCSEDDRRLLEVAFASDTPDDVLEALETRAAASRGAREAGPGQVSLTEAERERIDFSKGNASVPHARTAKGWATEHGVDDWLAYYDPELQADEHDGVMEAAARDESGGRMDAERSDEQRAAELERQGASECDHAEEHCRHGDPEACEFLTEECGLSDGEVDAILGEGDSDIADGELPGPAYAALSGQWNQFNAGIANAKEAAAAINEIRIQHDQALLEFEELGGREITIEDITW
jgi:hypothetical protein